MHVFSNGDNGMNMVKALAEVDSVKFTNDTIESEKLYTSKFYNDGNLFATFEDCSYDSVPKDTPNRDTTAAYTYTFKGWKRDESEIAKNKLTYTATYDSTISSYAVAFIGENHEVYSHASLAYGTMPIDPRDNGINPTKASTRLNDFVFYKWNPDLAEVETDIVYWAQFTSSLHPYTCMFYNCDTLFKTVENCAYDYEPAIDTPKRDSTAYYAYRFMGWSKDTSMVARDTLIYTAVYDTTKILYTRLYYNCDTLFKEIGNCAYDSVVTMDNPKRKSTEVYKYDFNSWSLDMSKIARDTLVYTAVYDSTEHGILTYASFKVSDTRSIYFSKGNLQFTSQGSHKTADGTADGTWRFAENQYDHIGLSNGNISNLVTFGGWIDLFGWGTSGWKSKATCYQPWSKSESYSDYYPGGSSSNNLVGAYAKADWGVYNAISNGGNEPQKWRTLDRSEWQYLFKNNKWTLGYIKTTEKDSSLCFMLIPETFTASEGTIVEVIGTADLSSTSLDDLTNTYTTDEFASLEKLGVVALPCGGRRRGTSIYDVGSYGHYWSSSTSGSNNAWEFYFYDDHVYSGGGFRYYGYSVRLVQDLK